MGELVSKARATLDEDGVIKLTALGPSAARSAVVQRLCALGFEATKSLIRRPIAAQLADALAQGSFVPVKSIASFVRGGSAAEAKTAAAKLIENGMAVRVFRGSAEVIVPTSAPVLSPDELLAARRLVQSLSKVLAKVTKARGATLLTADVVDEIRDALPVVVRSTPSKASVRAPAVLNTHEADPLGLVLEAVDATRDEKVGLSFIPRVVDHLRPELGAATVQRVLLEAAGRGIVELRPEGGLNRLTADELELCLPGPQGTRLSWARRTEGTVS
ncbi:MAG TPA: hypothetical protein VH062_24115 [Polyangiaceae bacterium]|nr:hypothetical protein [Polyangiaceae bacterium]